MNSEMFAKLPPTQLFFKCAVPAVVTSVFGALYSVVDGIFVGRFLGSDALAAINLIMPIILIVEAISNMIATGASVNISMLLGKQKREEASAVFSFSYLVGWIDMCISSYFTALDQPTRSIVVSVFGTVVFPVLFLFLLTAIFGLNGVWLMATDAGLASGILTLVLAKTMKLKPVSAEPSP